MERYFTRRPPPRRMKNPLLFGRFNRAKLS
jgi:hypothetical protein